MAHDEKELIEKLDEILSVLRHQLANSVNALQITLSVSLENYEQFDDYKRTDYLRRSLDLVERQRTLIESLKREAAVFGPVKRGNTFTLGEISSLENGSLIIPISSFR